MHNEKKKSKNGSVLIIKKIIKAKSVLNKLTAQRYPTL